MRLEDAMDRIGACGVVAVIRGVGEEPLQKTVAAILEGGVDCIELAMSVRGGLRELTLLKSAYKDGLVIGAGEVLNRDMATQASAAQADFCCGIGANAEMVRTCIDRNILPIPGALTPTEIQEAWHAGATLVKLFPSEMLAPQYIGTMRRILSRVELMPSGGIDATNAAEFVRGGAHSVGAGRNVIDPDAIERGDFEQISRNVAAIREAVASAKE